MVRPRGKEIFGGMSIWRTAERRLPRVKRAEMLVQSDSISKTDYDLKVANLRTAEADLNAGKANEATAQLNLEFTTVRASVSGRDADHTATTLGCSVCPSRISRSSVAAGQMFFSI